MAITKYRTQLFATSEQVTLHLRQAQKALATLGRNVAERLQQALRARANDLLASSRSAVVLTSGKIAKCRTQLFATSEQVTPHFRQAQKRLATLGRNVAERLQQALRARANDLLASSRSAVILTSGKIAKCRTQLLATSEQVTLHLGQAQTTLTRLGRRVVDKPRRLREALRTRENDLRKLLASPLDAVVVTDVDHRFVAANRKALDLFGVSEANLRNFTIDAFLPRGQILYFDGNGSPFIGREERHGECKVRRMDGSLRAAEYSFVANFVPRRHLCRFRNVKTPQVIFNCNIQLETRPNDSNSSQLH
jgi:PAS domain S-box-containing protein